MVKVNIGHLKRNNLKPKTKETKSEVTKVKGNNLLPQEIDITFDIVEDNELNSYLISKSKELIGIQATARLELGKIFQEVHEKLAGNKHTGLYVKWLSLNGYNKMTALRHRNRYELYLEMKSDNSKMIAATAPQRLVDTLLTHENKINLVNRLNSSMTKQELIDALESNPTLESTEPVEFNVVAEFDSFKTRYKKIDVTKLSNKKQLELKKLLDKFNKLFQ